jgi:hypothetical protein
MKKILIAILIVHLTPIAALTQGFNHTWLLGTDTGFPMGRIEFNSNSYTLLQQQNKMTYNGTEGTICDANGNFLMSSNGVWIANANNDTMMNGAGLNPGYFVNSYPDGLLIDNGNIILPYPDDSNKYVLIHQTENDPNYPSNYLYYSIIDMNLDSGRGAVISKNDTILNDTIIWGIAACRHANGRDWWIATMKDNTDTALVVLFTQSGVASISKQCLGFGYATPGNSAQLKFSEAGDKLVYSYSIYFQSKFNIVISNFDRCSGLLTNSNVVQISNNDFVFGLAFSATGEYVYACTSNEIIQFNTSTQAIDTVAIYDGFCFPNNPWCTTFWDMYLAANGKIYITSGSAVQHIHEMNFPDSSGIGCDVQQHSIFLNGIWNLRAVPNHPNYYLGCDTTLGCPCLITTGINENANHDFRFRIYPNPITSNNLSIGYLLPQNKAGVFQIIDITGKVVFKYNLPQWSNEQSLNLPDLSNGVYSGVVTSNNYRVSKKLIVIRE